MGEAKEKGATSHTSEGVDWREEEDTTERKYLPTNMFSWLFREMTDFCRNGGGSEKLPFCRMKSVESAGSCLCLSHVFPSVCEESLHRGRLGA